MELYGRSSGRNGSQTDHSQQAEWIQPGTETGLEESIRRLGLWGGGEYYPERPGTADCAYYMRTGTCGYGSKCRYNHPPDRSNLGGGGARSTVGGAYPERPGELPCQYYLRTGTCKFGASCKFHHPRHAGGSLSNVPLNTYGYPLRPEEKECSYYLKTGQCKFGITCKFHHPEASGEGGASAARPFYSSVQSGEQYGNYSRVGRPPLAPPPAGGSYAYGPILVSPPGMLPWSPYSGRVSPVLSPPGAASVYPPPPPPPPPFGGGHFRPLPSSERGVFPERPGEPECQYYMKTGDCKFGGSCKFHHPPDCLLPNPNCLLSPIGLPLRPGAEACTFYMQNGHCKFGRTCKFDHPLPAAAAPSLDFMFTQGQTAAAAQTSPQTR